MNVEIDKFLKSLNKLAPLQDCSYEKFKMPYKPAIILAIFKTCENEKFLMFEQEIDFSEYDPSKIGTKIVKCFYDIIISIPEVYDLLKKYCSKEMIGAINVGFNIKTFQKIRTQIFNYPLYRLSKSSKFISINKENKTVKFNFEYAKENLEETIETIIVSAYNSLKKSIKYYENLELDNILNYEEYKFSQRQLISTEKKKTETYTREFHHLFSKQVKDRDTKCVICCEDFPGLLEAAHIKPFSKCDFSEEYDLYNGITLCKTHHSLFDQGYFTFNNDLTITLSTNDEFKDYKEDLNLKFKQYESCLNSIMMKKSTLSLLTEMNKYFEYHKEYIFKK